MYHTVWSLLWYSCHGYVVSMLLSIFQFKPFLFNGWPVAHLIRVDVWWLGNAFHRCTAHTDTHLPLECINRHYHTGLVIGLLLPWLPTIGTVNTGRHGNGCSGWQNRGNRKGFPFNCSDGLYSHVDSPSTALWHGRGLSPSCSIKPGIPHGTLGHMLWL